MPEISPKELTVSKWHTQEEKREVEDPEIKSHYSIMIGIETKKTTFELATALANWIISLNLPDRFKDVVDEFFTYDVEEIPE